jgi:signal transduction histidine kinase
LVSSKCTHGSADIWRLFDVSLAKDDRGLAEYLSGVLAASAVWFRSTGASIFLATDDPSAFLLAARAGADATMPDGAKVYAGKGIAGAAIDAGEPILVEDPSGHSLLSGRVDVVRKEIGSAMVIPLIASPSGCVGVLNLSRRRGEPPFSSDDLALARSMAAQIALAVANARLVAQLGEALSEAQRLKDRLSAVIASVGLGLVVIDRSGRVTGVNPEARALLRTGDSSGPWQEAFRGAPSHLLDALHDSIRASLAGSQRNVRVREETGDKAWWVLGSPTPEGGAVVAVHDLSELEHAHAEMARLARLAEIGQMAAAIAHEIRNPLTGILGAAQVVRDDPEASHEFGQIIESEVLKLNALCDDFLDFARPLRVHAEPLDLSDVLARVVRAHEAEFVNAGVGLELKTESNEPIIEADPIRLEQVARNLLLNALQACKPGDRVSVTVGLDWFSVEDNGHGMDEETQERLFAPFFTTRPKGTGLGLSNVRKILDAHGGSVEVLSEPGRGTRMTVRFGWKEAA